MAKHDAKSKAVILAVAFYSRTAAEAYPVHRQHWLKVWVEAYDAIAGKPPS